MKQNHKKILQTKKHDNTQNDSAIDEKSKVRKEFITITSKFNQGNAKVAYDEYTKLIAKVQNDTSLLALSKVFYEIGFFSLGDSAIEKIVYKNQFYDNILDLESSYKPKSILSNEDEIYFAKAYSNIYFNNSADETIAELLEKKTQYVKNDFYNSILARAYFETRQYNLALNMINKAISLNPSNISYQIFKVETLIQNKKYSEAKKLIEKIEKTKLLIAYKPKLEILKQTVLAQVSSDINEKKYHIANKNFLEGNFEKSLTARNAAPRPQTFSSPGNPRRAAPRPPDNPARVCRFPAVPARAPPCTRRISPAPKAAAPSLPPRS